tara:strand:+ start:1278 stop:1604 length:327 start_codon:yes stop_codon:yes gene_type:complete
MKSNTLDKIISSIFIIISFIIIIFWSYNYFKNLQTINSMPVDLTIEIIIDWIIERKDVAIIVYIFTCLQLAAISELKQKQNYLVVALISIVFTPIGLLFIKNDKKTDK